MRKYAFGALLLVVAMACEKKEETNQDPDPVTPSAPSVEVDADAFLIALKTTTVIDVPVFGEQMIQSGSATASFMDGKGGTAPQNAGTVECEGEELKNQNNSYFYQPSATNTEGISFGSSVGWSVAGNGDVPAFNETYNREVPEIGSLSSVGSEVEISGEFTFGYSSTGTDVSEADSIIFNVIDQNGTIITQTHSKSTTSVTFSTDDMGKLTAGGGYVQVAAFNYEIRDVSGYKVVFINEGVNTKAVSLK